jgi:hypothetical protein
VLIKKRKQFTPFFQKIIFCFLIMISACNSGHRNESKGATLEKSLLEKISDHSVSLADLNNILKNAKPNSFKPSDLSSIVNDTTFNPIQRRKCLFYLFSNYVKTPISLDSLMQVVGKMVWLKQENVEWVFAETGVPLFERDNNGQHFAIIPRLPSNNSSAIHLELIFNKKHEEATKVGSLNEFMLKVLKTDKAISRETLKNIFLKRLVVVEDGKIIVQ